MTALPLLLLLAAPAPEPQKPVSPLSEMPATFTPPTAGFDHERREVYIPMRDGMKLFEHLDDRDGLHVRHAVDLETRHVPRRTARAVRIARLLARR